MSSSKASSYVTQLTEARCNAQWAQVPELARKVEKHAASRRCLYIAARAGALLNTRKDGRAYTEALEKYGEPLSTAIQEQENPAEDVLDAAVTRASMLFGAGDDAAVLSLLRDPMHTVERPSQGTGAAGWAAVVVLHGTLIRGLALERTGDKDEAFQTLRSVIGYLSHVVSLPTLCPELRRCSEELIAHMCVFFSNGDRTSPQHLGETMACLHILKHLLDSQGGSMKLSRTEYSSMTSRKMWAVYYEALSRTMQEGLVYHPSPLDRDHETLEHRGLLEDGDYSDARKAQRAELKQVESNYEAVLLKETRFPKANESNEEVERFADLVVQNWRVLCGPSWSEGDLGPGGRLAVGRNTLDILYRATTKTFHSTRILRHLFDVHIYLAEFDLAFKAFDKYVEIMNRGKSRAKKSGSAGSILDDDDHAIRAAADAIRVYIRYGSSETAKKACEIGDVLRAWISDTPFDDQGPSSPIERPNTASKRESGIKESIAPDLVAIAQRAIGASKANLARYTFESIERNEMRRSAEVSLRIAIRYANSDSEAADTLYTMAVLLAESRDIAGAMDAAKKALQRASKLQSSATSNGFLTSSGKETATTERDFSSEIRLLPAFHLLALLMTSCEDYEAAVSFCDAAFDQFEDPSSLFGDGTLPGFVAGSVATINEKAVSSTYGIVDSLSFVEKQQILEIKMTRVSLVETIDGPEHAVNACSELISLYARLFGTMNLAEAVLAKPPPPAFVPQSSRGTIRSMFRRSRIGPPMFPNAAPADDSRSIQPTIDPSRPTTNATAAPTIKVNGTEEAEPRASSVHRRTLLHPLHGEDYIPRPRNSLKKKSGPPTMRQASIKEPRSPLRSQDTADTGNTEPTTPTKQTEEYEGEAVGRQESAGQPLTSIPHDLSQEKAPPPSGHQNQPPLQDTRLPTPSSKTRATSLSPQFVYTQQQCQRITLLVKLWLFIGDLFAKTALYDDAGEAISEARRLADLMQLEVSKESSSIKNFQHPGWGGGKSVEAIWADVHAARGQLLALQELPHEAIESFETALFHLPDHVGATIGLSKILLDIYCEIIPSNKAPASLDASLAEVYPKQRKSKDDTETVGPTAATENGSATTPFPLDTRPVPSRIRTNGTHASSHSASAPTSRPAPTLSTALITSTLSNPMAQSAKQEPNLPTPETLTLLMHRDRAHALLSSLTKLGSAWNNAEAWLTLARAYEEADQEEQAREALWKVVLLEDDAPIRGWFDALGQGAFVLGA